MAVYFNDLTIVKDDPQQNCRLLPEFFKVMKSLRAATEDREKRVFVNDDAAPLWEAVYSSGNQDLIQKYSSVFKLPFQDDETRILIDKAEFHTGGEAEYRIKIDEAESVECKILGWANYDDAITLGLASTSFWNKKAIHSVLRKTIEDDREVIEPIESICITSVNHIKDKNVREWIDDHLEDEEQSEELPEKCLLPPDKKHLKIQMHDGRDLMLAFAEKLNRNCYVQGVVDSIRFESTTSRFISKCYPDGKIDLRMHWTRKGLGIQVQTMARGLPQTRLVANVLRRKYDRCS